MNNTIHPVNSTTRTVYKIMTQLLLTTVEIYLGSIVIQMGILQVFIEIE